MSYPCEIYILDPYFRKEESESPTFNPNEHCIVSKKPCDRPDWAELRKLQLFCDGVIVSEDGDRVLVHKALLATTSSYFRAAFSSPLGADTIHLHCSTHVLNSILDFIYAGTCYLTEQTAKEVLQIADMYDLQDLTKHCFLVLRRTMRPENCVGLHKLSQYLSFKHLEDSSLHYILHNFEEVVKSSEELYNLDADALERYLMDDLLNIRSEQKVEEVVKRWVERDCESRLKEKERLMRHTRTNEPDTSRRIWSRAPHEVIVIVGGYEDEQSVSGLMETYDPRSKEWLEWGVFTQEYRAYHGLAVVDGCVYIVGGFDGSDFLSSVRKYDTINRYWTDVSHMVMARCFVSVVVLGGFIYALGGRSVNGERLQYCECYDVSQNQWYFIPPMHCKRSDAAAAVFLGKIYVAGGYDGASILENVEMYDPQTMRWTFFANLPSPRSGLQLVAYRDRLFALGGYDGDNRLDSVLSITASGSVWMEEKNMLLSRSNFAAVPFEDRIWVIGGYGQEIGTLNETESFSFEDGWTAEHSLSCERSCLAGTVLSNIADPKLYSSKYRWTDYADHYLYEVDVGDY